MTRLCEVSAAQMEAAAFISAEDQAISDSVARRLGYPLTRFEVSNLAADIVDADQMRLRAMRVHP